MESKAKSDDREYYRSDMYGEQVHYIREEEKFLTWKLFSDIMRIYACSLHCENSKWRAKTIDDER